MFGLISYIEKIPLTVDDLLDLEAFIDHYYHQQNNMESNTDSSQHNVDLQMAEIQVSHLSSTH